MLGTSHHFSLNALFSVVTLIRIACRLFSLPCCLNLAIAIGFYSRPIVLDGVAAIKYSVLSTGWNPVSKIVGFISEDEQITAIQELKKTFPNKDSAIKFVFRNSSLLYSYEKTMKSTLTTPHYARLAEELEFLTQVESLFNF